MKNLLKTKAKKGFSLVELLVVIAVIGVIAAIAIPAMSGIFVGLRRNARASGWAWNQTCDCGAPGGAIGAS